ncbi:MAG: hypothetical protein QG608_363 [Actinomycetota bacterium]|nr:hypothetical protein [Actinomycetota bacterium]
MRNLSTIAEHYQRRSDINERNEVAAWFHREYLEAVRVGLEPEDVLLRLREFLAGSRQRKAPLYRAQTAVLAYFFETCDIFENPPSDWEPAMVGSLT